MKKISYMHIPRIRMLVNMGNGAWTSDKVKVGVLYPVQQPGSYWDRSAALSLVQVKSTQRGQPVIRCQKIFLKKGLLKNASKSTKKKTR